MCCFVLRVRKGQFFILGTIMIVLALYVLSETLMSSKMDDPSFVQDNGARWIVDETEKGLYRLAMKDLEDEIEIFEFVEMQQEIARESGYSLDFRLDYEFEPYTEAHPNSYTLVIQSSGTYMENRNRILPYYARCKIADDGGPMICGFLDSLVMAGYESACCDIYGLCC